MRIITSLETFSRIRNFMYQGKAVRTVRSIFSACAVCTLRRPHRHFSSSRHASVFLALSREPESSSFDWFKRYSDIADIMRELIPDKSSRVLMLGCGNSTLSQDVCVTCTA